MKTVFSIHSSALRWLALFGLCCAGAIIYAQFDTATVLGTVHDSSGSVVPGVAITLRNINTGITSATQTDDKGDYQFLTVRPGTYQVSAAHTGFSTATAENFTVTVNARQRVDLTLQVGSVSSQVAVNAGVQFLETDSSEKGQIPTRPPASVRSIITSTEITWFCRPQRSLLEMRDATLLGAIRFINSIWDCKRTLRFRFENR
jgi:hypothetical protein